MIAAVLLAAAVSATAQPFTLHPKPSVLNARQAQYLKAVEPCLKLNAEQAAYRKLKYSRRGGKAPQGQYAVIRQVGACSLTSPVR